MSDDEPRVPTQKWQHLPERIDPSELVETVDKDPQVEEIEPNTRYEVFRVNHQ